MSRLNLGPRLNDLLVGGKTLTTKTCVCGQCAGEFFVVAMSEEFLPRFCCYCGCEFTSRRTLEDR